MAKFAGRLGRLAIDTGGGFVDINGIVDMSFPLDTAEIDTTAHDDDLFRDFIQGRISGTITGTLHNDPADAGQTDLRTSKFARDEFGIRYREQTGTGFREFTATRGFCTSYEATSPNDDAADISFSIRPAGTITDTAQ